jgi:glucose-6-phosphate 1-epimerase
LPSPTLTMTPSAIPMPPGVVLQPGHGNLQRLSIDTPACTGEIYLHGAHVTAWQPRGCAPVIWMSGCSTFEPGRPIRGGVPICFPWFGPHPSDPGRAPHGFARLVPWTLDSVVRGGDSVKVTLSLQTGGENHDAWPHRCALTYTADFGHELALELAVRNVGDSACVVQEALHTYFAVGDIRQVAVEGLAGATYVDKVRGGERLVQDATPIRFTGETDRPYVDSEAATAIIDATLKRRIVVEKQGSRTTVVWNPWIAKAKAMPDFGDDEWPSMVCVETANALDNAIALPPGAQHRLRARIRVE